MPAIRGEKSKKKTRRHTRDLDQVHADLRDDRHLEQFTETKLTEDLPGLGQWYCKECAKWFESENNFESHKKHKVHKRRVRALRAEPYSQKEAEAGMMGMTTNNGVRAPSKLTEIETGLVEMAVDQDAKVASA